MRHYSHLVVANKKNISLSQLLGWTNATYTHRQHRVWLYFYDYLEHKSPKRDLTEYYFMAILRSLDAIAGAKKVKDLEDYRIKFVDEKSSKVSSPQEEKVKTMKDMSNWIGYLGGKVRKG